MTYIDLQQNQMPCRSFADSFVPSIESAGAPGMDCSCKAKSASMGNGAERLLLLGEKVSKKNKSKNGFCLEIPQKLFLLRMIRQIASK